MATSPIPDAVKRLFTEAFTARDIAEPLASFDADADSSAVRAAMTARGIAIIAVRQAGRVTGFAETGSLVGGTCGQNRRALDEATIVIDSAPLLKVLLELKDAPYLFVTMLGEVAGIITRDDMQKPAVRMWLFGIVTLVEMRFSELIERHCLDESWKQFLSEARLDKARALLEERSRRNQRLRLLDCLQFADKGQIVARHEDIRKRTIFTSRSQAEAAVKSLEQLRNNLAHAQDILAGDWDTIVQLGEFIASA
jgi:hypothetical protein